MPERPSSIQQYEDWLKNEHGADLVRERAYYETVTQKLVQDLGSSPLWEAIYSDLLEALGDVPPETPAAGRPGLFTRLLMLSLRSRRLDRLPPQKRRPGRPRAWRNANIAAHWSPNL